MQVALAWNSLLVAQTDALEAREHASSVHKAIVLNARVVAVDRHAAAASAIAHEALECAFKHINHESYWFILSSILSYILGHVTCNFICCTCRYSCTLRDFGRVAALRTHLVQHKHRLQVEQKIEQK